MFRPIPILDWVRGYDRLTFGADLMAAVIVTIMLIPQSLAYALLAGLPAQVGLYASIAPLLLYAIFGTSRTLAVGPVAVVSLMTAAAVGQIAAPGTAEYLGAAIAMAVLSGLMLLAMGLLRLGFIANFLSHPVISGFISASAVLIAVGQLPALLGISAPGHTLPHIVQGIADGLPDLAPITLLIGSAALGFLWAARTRLKPALLKLGVAPGTAAVLVRAAPVLAVALTTVASWAFGLQARGVAVVGDIPSGLPMPALPPLDPALWQAILLPAALISLVGYVESVSVAQTLAAKRRQRIDPDQELVALGAANIGAGLSGGFPVTGGFARSVVNFDAGAQTPAAGAFTAIAIALATLFLTPLLFHLPKATLAATIIVAVLGLVDLAALRRVWAINRADFAAMATTILLTLGLGVEAGIAAGVALSLLLHLYRTSKPHVAVIGQVQGTEHYRNVLRHDVVTTPEVLALRIDEALYFPNARFLEDTLLAAVADDPRIRHVVLNCVAVNDIDSSAVESLEASNARLHDAGVSLHLAEVKGPVMDRLRRTALLQDLSGAVHLTMYDAMQALAPALARATRNLPRCETARA
ncbi:SulP family inorganic anion transporter [Pseudorhodobacter sp. MZDSW-24AT]|uniref:SulP family inorganic anion transporter n=1 Tax=Pseudorhodobacter sp. MZDSW-24AT TaxID=2052957 RepID=UPI001E478E59|nr:sulfate permease [Pseudorhodobacter sp. MZDSW-24AT]